MSFDQPSAAGQRIAIIGGGISGLAAAFLLSPQHRITLFEAEPRLGGHARTVMAGLNGDQPVDTGFIVFNNETYPNLIKMFDRLDVPVIDSNMSFGATVDEGRLEYALHSLGALVGQKRNLLRPQYYRMIGDILKFNKRAEGAATSDQQTVGELMDDLGMGEWFQRYYLLPICGAIWSTPSNEIHRFPARSLVQFFANHLLLSGRQEHNWKTVKGGSIEYVRRLERHLRVAGCDLRTGAPVSKVTRDAAGVAIASMGQEAERFDQVIFACHSDQALRLLGEPTADEAAALGDLNYQDNTVVLHRDARQMPRRRACWSSWVYKSDQGEPQNAIGVTYWMNKLQQIPDSDPMFISLNPVRDIPDEMIYDQNVFRHPVFDLGALAAQRKLKSIQGRNRTWFAGAYMRHGFHEDGFHSAVEVARQMESVIA